MVSGEMQDGSYLVWLVNSQQKSKILILLNFNAEFYVLFYYMMW